MKQKAKFKQTEMGMVTEDSNSIKISKKRCIYNDDGAIF